MIGLIVLSCTVLCILNSEKGHNWGGDYSLYIHQTKSINENRSHQLAIANKYVVENSSVHSFSPTLYPWGFPLLLTPIYTIYDDDYTAFRFLEVIFLVCALLMIFLSLRTNSSMKQTISLFFLAFGYGVYAIIVMVLGLTVSGWASIIAAIVFLSGLQLVVLGVMGEYIGKLYLENKQRPHYLISKTNVNGTSSLLDSYKTRKEGSSVLI